MVEDKRLHGDDDERMLNDQKHDRELIEAGFADFEVGHDLTDEDMRKRFAQYGWQ